MQLLWKTRSEPFGDPSTPGWQVCCGVGWWQVVALRGGGEESASPWCQAHSREECWRLRSQGSGGSPAWNRYLAAFSTTSGGERAFSSGSSQTSSSWLCSLSHRWERGKVSFLNKCAVPYLLLFSDTKISFYLKTASSTAQPLREISLLSFQNEFLTSVWAVVLLGL